MSARWHSQVTASEKGEQGREEGGSDRRIEGKDVTCSLIPRSSYHPGFDRLQYAKMEREGLVHFIT